MILSIQNTSKRKGRRNLYFKKNETKIKASKTLSPAIHLEGSAGHFKHEYIIKLSENLIES